MHSDFHFCRTSSISIYLPAVPTAASAERTVSHGGVLHVGLSSRHARATAIAFHAVRPAIAAEAGAVLLGTAETAIATAVLIEHLAAAIASVVARMLNPTVAADQAMISVRATVGRIRAFFGVPAAIGAEITVRVVPPVWPVVSVRARVVTRIRMIVAIRAVVSAVLRSRRPAAPGVVTVIV
jgi:hypothetical protein